MKGRRKQTIEVRVAPDGAIAIEAEGYTGSTCEEATRFLEEALGLPGGCVRRVTAQPPAPRFGQRLIACGVARGLSAPIAA